MPPPGWGGARSAPTTRPGGRERCCLRLHRTTALLGQSAYLARYYAGFGRSQYHVDKEWDYTPFSGIVAAIAQLLEEGKVRASVWGAAAFEQQAHGTLNSTPRPVL